MIGMAGDAGLLASEDCLLPEVLATSSRAPSPCATLAEGVVALGEDFPVGVPNWMRVSLRLGQVTSVLM